MCLFHLYFFFAFSSTCVWLCGKSIKYTSVWDKETCTRDGMNYKVDIKTEFISRLDSLTLFQIKFLCLRNQDRNRGLNLDIQVCYCCGTLLMEFSYKLGGWHEGLFMRKLIITESSFWSGQKFNFGTWFLTFATFRWFHRGF